MWTEKKLRGLFIIGVCLLLVLGFAISVYFIVVNTLKII